MIGAFGMRNVLGMVDLLGSGGCPSRHRPPPICDTDAAAEPRHELLASAVPRYRRSRDLDTAEKERARIERWHETLDRSLPTQLVPGFDRRYG